MRIMFVSDIHGSKANLRKVREIYNQEKADIIIILGDLFYGRGATLEIEELINSFPNKVVIKGNNDYVSDIFTSKIDFVDNYLFSAFNKNFFCSHGDVYSLSRFPNKDFDILVFGHSHVGRILFDGEKYFINPGSVSFPRNGSQNSYIIVDDSGIYLKNLEGYLLDKLLW